MTDPKHVRPIEYSWQDDMPWGVENTVYEDAYGLLDARIALSPRAGGWEITVYGKNLDDELYRFDTIPFLGEVFSRFGPPRSFGVQATLDF
jgi:iron complex outermembrane receptor protein